MTNDVRGMCEAVSRLNAHCTARPAVALGWKLENAALAGCDLDALRTAAATGARAASPRGHWAPSPALRAFLREYQRVRSGRSPQRARAGTQPLRPVGCG